MSSGVQETMKTEFERLLQETLKSERQWLRPQRIQRAKYMAGKATTPEEKRLWVAVAKANSY